MNEWSSILYLASFNTLIIGVILIMDRRNLISLANFYIISYWICFYLGIYIAFYIYIRTGSYKSIDPDKILDSLVVGSFGFYLSLIPILIGKLFRKRLSVNIFPTISLRTVKVAGYTMVVFALIAVFVYVLFNDGFVLLKDGDYQNRYSSNRGLGLLSILMKLYVPGLVIIFLCNPSRKYFKYFLVLSVFIGILTYTSLGGYRQIALGGLVTFFMISILMSYSNIKKYIYLSPLLLIAMFLMAVFRYEVTFESIDAIFTLGLYFTVDSLSPFDSFIKIIDYVEDNNISLNLNLFFNQFLSLVPRWLWTDKPDLISNAGNFFTKEILHLRKDTTISPTLNGELFLINGAGAFYLGMFFLGIVLSAAELTLKYHGFSRGKDILHSSFFLFCIFNSFWLVREGFAVFLYRNLLNYLFFLIFIFVALVVQAFLKVILQNEKKQ